MDRGEDPTHAENLFLNTRASEQAPMHVPDETTAGAAARRSHVDRGLWIGLVFLFTMGICMAAAAAAVLPASVSAFRGQGQPGTAVATVVDCNEDSCTQRGNYTSADGTITFRNIGLHGGGWQKGRPVAALYEGRSLFGPLVFPANDRYTWRMDAFVLIVGCALTISMPVLGILAVRGRLE